MSSTSCPSYQRPDRLRGKKLTIGHYTVSITKKIGEGGSSFLYLAKTIGTTCIDPPTSTDVTTNHVVLKATAVATFQQYQQAENEVHMLRRLSCHPNVIHFFDNGFSSPQYAASHDNHRNGNGINDYDNDDDEGNPRVHYLLMEYCDRGTLMDLIMKYRDSENGNSKKKTSFIQRLMGGGSSGSKKHSQQLHNQQQQLDDNDKFMDKHLILNLFRQMADVVAFMHNRYENDETNNNKHNNREDHQKGGRMTTRHLNPIIHRDLKPENFLLTANKSFLPRDNKHSNHDNNNKNDVHHEWQVKLCDFGSAIVGRVPLHTAKEREEAARMIRRTTTQMYRSPEMIDIHMVDELTELTDVWSLGCCLYYMCFLRHCFEQNENLAILGGRYTIPNDHPYGEDMTELIRDMLVVDPSKRISINVGIECIDAMRKRI